MRMNSGIILGGQSPDILGNMARGAQAAQFENDAQQTNAFRAMLQEQGPGIMQGQENALASLAQFDPQAALGVQSTRQSMRIQEQQAQQAYAAANRAAQGWAQQQDAATRATAAEQLERALAMGTQAQTPEQWDQVMQSVGAADYVGQFGNRQMLIAGALGLRDALTMGQGGPEFRAATPEEAAQFGAAGGQFGPDGRFYPINPPSGMTVETMPGGGVRMVQGAGVGATPTFTEGQGRDNVYSTRARGALERLEPVADALMSRGEIVAGMVPLGLARGAQTPEFQQAEAAGTEFLQAILRKDTGAAITTQEREEYGRVYLPQPGDSPEVLAARREARARALAAMESGMSQAQIEAQTRALAETIAAVSGGGRPQPMAPAPQPQPPTPRAAPAPAQSQAVTPDAIFSMPIDDVLMINPAQLDAAGVEAMLRRLEAGQ